MSCQFAHNLIVIVVSRLLSLNAVFARLWNARFKNPPIIDWQVAMGSFSSYDE